MELRWFTARKALTGEKRYRQRKSAFETIRAGDVCGAINTVLFATKAERIGNHPPKASSRMDLRQRRN